MLTLDELEARRLQLAESSDLEVLLAAQVMRARRVVQAAPPLPALKGMLSADGGVCPDDQHGLRFDPLHPGEHRCPACGKTWRGPRHDQRWAWLAHLWRAERLAAAALAGGLGGDEAVVDWAVAGVHAYGEHYADYPNRDNVLGPARLFFSTYLESIWLTNYVAAAYLLREQGALDEDALQLASGVIEEAANLIGEFDEGLSNRQTWHNAALTAAGVWFEDEDLVARALEAPRGLVGHLVDGFGADGMWYEGENYHLFALRGMLVGADWARLAGVELFEEDASRDRLVAALRAPLLTALPDWTFPARKDARFAVSLAQPMYLELWERGAARLLAAGAEAEATEIAGALQALYLQPAPPAQTFDSYLQEAGEEAPERRGRADLSWWMLATMAPALPDDPPAWSPGSVLLPEQGLAVLRQDGSWASVECGAYGGGHGHPDRLHLSWYADGVHWLADPGTGTYVSQALHWYRSTLAHNAPRVDGRDQAMASAHADMFDVQGDWSWVRGRFGPLTRTVVLGPRQLVDVVEFAGDEEHLVELPWHFAGEVAVVGDGRWEPATLDEPWLERAERHVPAGPGPIRIRAIAGERVLELVTEEGAEVWRARAPRRPDGSGGDTMLLLRRRGRYVRFASVLQVGGGLTGATFASSEIVAETAAGPVTHQLLSDGWQVRGPAGEATLRGFRRQPPRIELPPVTAGGETQMPSVATAFHLAHAPVLDGSLAGFETAEPIHLDHEDQYRRTEEPYPGPEALAARAWLGWDERELFVAVEVDHPSPVFRSASAPPLQLDNEPDLIHADGVQVYVQLAGAPAHGWLVAPDPAGPGVGVRGVGGLAGQAGAVRGAWQRTDTGYRVTLAIAVPDWPPGANDDPPRFDLVVNEMAPGRLRRQGQLVWTGGGGWAYLRGDRQDPRRFGGLVLA